MKPFRPLLRWFRTWIRPVWFLPLMVVLYIVFEIQYLRALAGALGPNPFDVKETGLLRDVMMLILVFIAGALRKVASSVFLDRIRTLVGANALASGQAVALGFDPVEDSATWFSWRPWCWPCTTRTSAHFEFRSCSWPAI